MNNELNPYESPKTQAAEEKVGEGDGCARVLMGAVAFTWPCFIAGVIAFVLHDLVLAEMSRNVVFSIVYFCLLIVFCYISGFILAGLFPDSYDRGERILKDRAVKMALIPLVIGISPFAILAYTALNRFLA